MASSLCLMNACKRHWGSRFAGVVPDFVFSEADKSVVKENLLQAILSQNNSRIRKIMTEAMVRIAEIDYPASWPSLLPSIVTYIQSGDFNKMYRALIPLRYLTKMFELKDPSDRAPVTEIVSKTFPLLLNLGRSVLTGYRNIEAAEFLKIILKIYWSASHFILPLELTDQPTITAWMEMLNGIMLLRLPEASENVEPLGQPTLKEDRNEWQWWKH